MLPPESQHLVISSIPEPNLGEDDEDKDLEPGPSGTSKASAQISGQSDTDITAEFLQPLLTPDNVANLVRTHRVFSHKAGRKGLQSFPAFLLHTAYLLHISDLKHFCFQGWEGVVHWAFLTLDGPLLR